MLVLSRSEGDSISLPDLDVVIQILRISGSKVRVGVDGPREIKVLRTEVVERKQAEMGSEPDLSRRQLLQQQLDALSISLEAARRHLNRGDASLAELAVRQVIDQLLSRSPDATLVDEQSESYNDPGILLLEDAAPADSLLAHALQVSGFRVRLARGVDVAMQELESEVPRLLVVNLNRPEKEVVEFAQRMRDDRRYRHVAVYAVAGADSAGLSSQHPSNIRAWFQKPIHMPQLLQAIETDVKSDSLCC